MYPGLARMIKLDAERIAIYYYLLLDLVVVV